MAAAASTPADRGHHAVSQMQLIALGLSSWLAKRRFCCCVPLLPGGILLCCLLLTRGACELYAASYPGLLAFILDGWWAPGRRFLIPLGLGDLAVGTFGLFGIGFRKVWLTASLPLWLLVLIPLGGVLRFVYLLLEAAGERKIFWDFLVCTMLLLIDVSLFLFSCLAYFMVLLKSSFAPSAVRAISEAQRVALVRGDETTDKRHLLAYLLQDDDVWRLFETGGADVERMAMDIARRVDVEDAEELSFGSFVPMLGKDLEQVMHLAARTQWKLHDTEIRLDHIISALCDNGIIMVSVRPDRNAGPELDQRLKEYIVDANIIREHFAAIRKQVEDTKLTRGPPGARILGCLPLEETVAAYALFQILAYAYTLLRILFLERGPEEWLRPRPFLGHHSLLLWIMTILGFIFNCVGFYGVLQNRRTRQDVKEAAHELGARWDTEFGQAFDMVRGDLDSRVWLSALQRSSNCIAALIGWNVIDLCIEVPIFGMLLVQGNICGLHMHSIVKFASTGPPQNQQPLHCDVADTLLILFLAARLTLRLYALWALQALWHEYSFGWTTTDLAGIGYVHMFTPVSEAVARTMAGLPRFAQRRFGDSGEVRPLLKP